MADPYARMWGLGGGTLPSRGAPAASAAAPYMQVGASATSTAAALARGGQGGPRTAQVGPDLLRAAAPPRSRHAVGSSLPSRPGSGIKRNTPTVSRRVANKMAKFGGDLAGVEGSLADLRKTRLLYQRGFVSPDDVNVLAAANMTGVVRRGPGRPPGPAPGSVMPLVAQQTGPTDAQAGGAFYEQGMTPGTVAPVVTNPIAVAPSQSGGPGATANANLNVDYAAAAATTTGRTVPQQMAPGGVQSMPTPAQQQAPAAPPRPARSVMFSRMEAVGSG